MSRQVTNLTRHLCGRTHSIRMPKKQAIHQFTGGLTLVLYIDKYKNALGFLGSTVGCSWHGKQEVPLLSAHGLKFAALKIYSGNLN